MSAIEFLFPSYRQRVLGLLLVNPDKNYHVREIARLTKTSAGSLHRELATLAKAEVLLREKSGHQVYYRANINFLLYEELTSIVRKTSGLADILANALLRLEEKIEVAFIFGSVARGSQNSASDIDILIIGEISFSDAATTLYPAQNILGREINPKVYTPSEWQKLKKSKNAFLEEILSQPKIFIIGNKNDIK